MKTHTHTQNLPCASPIWNYFVEEKIRQRGQFSFGSSVAETYGQATKEGVILWDSEIVNWLNKYVVRMCSGLTFTEISISLNYKEHIQGVPGGMDKTSGECSLCRTIPI